MGISSYFEKIFARRWIAGAAINDAITRTKSYNRKGIIGMINYLGEDITDKRMINSTVKVYHDLITAIYESKVNAVISVKPTQLGLKISKALFQLNYSKIVKSAKKNNVFVWLDMEGEGTVQQTIDVYLQNIKSGNTGICIQAYLKRSIGDIKILAKRNTRIRLVKGAYTPSADEGYKTWSEVTNNYTKILDYLIKKRLKVVIAATHDTNVIKKAEKRLKKNELLSFAMLNGIKTGYALDLAASGKTVYVYIPFGKDWLAYSYRRLKEAGHLSLIIKSIFERQQV